VGMAWVPEGSAVEGRQEAEGLRSLLWAENWETLKALLCMSWAPRWGWLGLLCGLWVGLVSLPVGSRIGS
jgi:hypothetical protein